MSDNWRNSGGCGLVRSKASADASNKRKGLRVVVGGGPGFAARATEDLHRLGWDVCTAMTGDDLHTLAVRKNPTAVLLPAESCGESGYLTCAKLRLTRPRLKIVLVGEPTPRARRFAGFVGAGFASEADAADAVLKLI